MMNIKRFPNIRSSVAGARHFVLAQLQGVSSETTDSLALIVTELATNCVQHAGTEFEVWIEQLPDQIYVAVADDGPGNPVICSPGVTEESGRGLQILGALADRWGITNSAERQGKTVWAMLRTRASNPDVMGRAKPVTESFMGRAHPATLPVMLP